VNCTYRLSEWYGWELIYLSVLATHLEVQVTHTHIHTHAHTHTHIYLYIYIYGGWNFNSGNYLFSTDTK